MKEQIGEAAEPPVCAGPSDPYVVAYHPGHKHEYTNYSHTSYGPQGNLKVMTCAIGDCPCWTYGAEEGEPETLTESLEPATGEWCGFTLPDWKPETLWLKEADCPHGLKVLECPTDCWNGAACSLTSADAALISECRCDEDALRRGLANTICPTHGVARLARGGDQAHG